MATEARARAARAEAPVEAAMEAQARAVLVEALEGMAMVARARVDQVVAREAMALEAQARAVQVAARVGMEMEARAREVLVETKEARLGPVALAKEALARGPGLMGLVKAGLLVVTEALGTVVLVWEDRVARVAQVARVARVARVAKEAPTDTQSPTEMVAATPDEELALTKAVAPTKALEAATARRQWARRTASAATRTCTAATSLPSPEVPPLAWGQSLAVFSAVAPATMAQSEDLVACLGAQRSILPPVSVPLPEAVSDAFSTILQLTHTFRK